MHRRTALVLAAAAAAASVVAAVPSSARLVPAQPAGDVTTIVTASSGTAEVVLYDDATLSRAVTHNPDVSISGPGRLVAFDLTRADGGADELYGMRLPAFAGGAVVVGGSSSAPTCTPWPEAVAPLQYNCAAAKPAPIRLHEGYYHLVVLTDGQPVRIQLRLHGESRTHANLHMQKAIRTLEAALPERESIGATTVTYGTSVPFQNATQVLTVVEAKLHQSATVRAATGCARNDSGSTPPYAYSPPCPGGSSSGFDYLVNTPVTQLAGFGGGTLWLGLSNQSPTGIGGSFVDSDGPKYVGGIGVWVSGASLSPWMPFSSTQ